MHSYLRRWNSRAVVISLVSAVLVFSAAVVGVSTTLTAQEPFTLRVALYPYVPDRHGLFYALERAFEENHPGVNLELVDDADFTGSYYKGGLERADADVYEIDTILLSDMIAAGKIAPIELPDRDFVPGAIAAVTRDGKTYGVPHWVCGNFLFYRKGNTAIGDAKSWPELLDAVSQSGKPLLVDLKGSSGLGEWYLTALADLRGIDQAQEAIARGETLDEDVIETLRDIAAACPEGFCRSNPLHDRSGFYARAFVRGGHAAYIGYSESLHFGLQDAIENCLTDSGCLRADEIAVRRLPPFGPEGGKGVGWVDALAISSGLKGTKRDVAMDFIRFATSPDAYRAVLTPARNEAPRYLLPARTNIEIEKAVLYPALMAAHEGRVTGTAAGLNAKLKEMGGRVDCALPIPPDDTETKQECEKAE